MRMRMTVVFLGILVFFSVGCPKPPPREEKVKQVLRYESEGVIIVIDVLHKEPLTEGPTMKGYIKNLGTTPVRIRKVYDGEYTRAIFRLEPGEMVPLKKIKYRDGFYISRLNGTDIGFIKLNEDSSL